MRLTGLEQKRVPSSNFSYSVLVAHIAAAGDDQIKFGFRRVRMIGAERLPLGTRTNARSKG